MTPPERRLAGSHAAVTRHPTLLANEWKKVSAQGGRWGDSLAPRGQRTGSSTPPKLQIRPAFCRCACTRKSYMHAIESFIFERLRALTPLTHAAKAPASSRLAGFLKHH